MINNCYNTLLCIACQTVGGPDPYRQCVFPFRWNGKTYYGCPIDPDDSSHRWCSTKVDGYGNHVTGRGKYGYCSRSCPKHQSGRPYRPAPIKSMTNELFFYLDHHLSFFIYVKLYFVIW